MSEPAKSLRPLPPTPTGLFLMDKKPGDPGYNEDVKLASLRLLKESKNYQPGFDQQGVIIRATIQLIQTQSSSRDIEQLKGAFDEFFAYCLAANPTLKEKNNINLINLGYHIVSINTLVHAKKIPVDPVITTIDNICKLALNHQPSPAPAPLKSTLQRTSSGNSSPSLSKIARKLQNNPIPTDPSDYDDWLRTLKQNPPSNDLQEDTGELEGTLAYCLTSTYHALVEKITDLEKISIAIASQENPHLQRINRICQRAIELLKNPPPQPPAQEHTHEPNTSLWNLPKIAIVIALALGGIALLFVGFKHRSQLLQKGLKVISWIKRTISNKI